MDDLSRTSNQSAAISCGLKFSRTTVAKGLVDFVVY